MELAVHGDVPEARVVELRAYVRDHSTTGRLTAAAFAQGLDIADIHAMDEYSLDLVVPLPDGLVLVYGTT